MCSGWLGKSIIRLYKILIIFIINLQENNISNNIQIDIIKALKNVLKNNNKEKPK